MQRWRRSKCSRHRKNWRTIERSPISYLEETIKVLIHTNIGCFINLFSNFDTVSTILSWEHNLEAFLIQFGLLSFYSEELPSNEIFQPLYLFRTIKPED